MIRIYAIIFFRCPSSELVVGCFLLGATQCKNGGTAREEVKVKSSTIRNGGKKSATIYDAQHGVTVYYGVGAVVAGRSADSGDLSTEDNMITLAKVKERSLSPFLLH